MSDIDAWSSVAASNNSAAPDGAPEGMAPAAVNDTIRELMAATRRWYEDAEWRDFGHTVTYATATTFTIPGDVTATYTENRPIQCTDSSTLYGYISGSSYSAPNTTVTVVLDSGSLSASLSAVALGIDAQTQPIHGDSVRGGVMGLTGKKMVFYESTAPTGWTQVTSVNDKVLRVVSSSGGGSGGSWTISGLSGGSHTHGAGSYSIYISSNSGGLAGGTGVHTMPDTFPVSGTSGSSAVSISSTGAWRPAYIDVIVCSKD